MSLSRCIECDDIVDTDDDADCYYDHHGNDTACTCYWCRAGKQMKEEDL